MAGHRYKSLNSPLQQTSKPLLCYPVIKCYTSFPKDFIKRVKSSNWEAACSQSQHEKGAAHDLQLVPDAMAHVGQHCEVSTNSVTYLTRIKVRSGQKVFEVDVPLWLSLFQHDHGICLSQERPGSP